MSSEGFLKEMQTIGEKFLLKLQKLPKADPVEIVSFCVVLLFIGEFIGGSRGVYCSLPALEGRVCLQPGHSSLGWNLETDKPASFFFSSPLIVTAGSPEVRLPGSPSPDL
uniref:Small integral membrane protein 5 n=2 Tax=Neognathae TaxID=8825 RepID=A0A8C3CRK8_CAIMO